MRTLPLLLVIISFRCFAQPAPDYTKSFIETSKSWIDIDYVGDGIIGHKLDIFLPKEGQAPFPVIVTIYGSAFFSNSSKGACFRDGFGDRKSTRLNSSHVLRSRMPSSA